MNVYHDLSDLPDFQNTVITIGSFDGVHQGHQQILQKVKKLSQEVGGESVVITFHPHPRLVLAPDKQSLRLLNTIDEKVRLLQHYGIQHIVVVPFNKAFAQQSPKEYIESFLVQRFRPAYIVIGYDHRFGQNRAGTILDLKTYEAKGTFQIAEIEKQEIDDITVSSTKIRKALSHGDVRTAAQLMGHPYTLSGQVVEGQKIGRTINYPTANIEVGYKHKLVPPEGIYAVYVMHQQKQYEGMLYIGTRPTLEDGNHQTIEVNIFDFDKEIYGDKLQMEFVDFIREDKQLNGLEALQQQLADDKEQVLKVLKKKQQLTVEAVENKVHPSVAVLILNYNGRQHLENFLPLLLKSTYPNMEVIIADNCSTDDSVKWLRVHHPDIQIHQLPENYGFAGGYNKAIELVEADYFVLLNSDVEVRADWLEPVIELMEKDETIGACQPKVRWYQDRSLFEYAGGAGGWIDSLGYPFCRGRIFDKLEKDVGQYDQVQAIFWATGTALFIRPKLMKNLGGFDGDYFAHLEEIDLCWRLQRAGFKIMAVPQSVVYHVGGGTLDYNNPFKAYLNFRNSLFTLVKNEPISKLWWLIPLRLILDGVAGLLFISEGKFKHLQSILRAHGAFYSNFRRTLRRRAQYQDLINKVSIKSNAKLKGVYSKSIVWQYYIRRKKTFKDL